MSHPIPATYKLYTLGEEGERVAHIYTLGYDDAVRKIIDIAGKGYLYNKMSGNSQFEQRVITVTFPGVYSPEHNEFVYGKVGE